MARNNSLKLIAVVLLAGIAGWLFYRQSDSPSKFDLSPYRALGVGAAEETVKLLGNKGTVLVIIEDTSGSKNAALDGELKSFQDTIKKDKAMTIAATGKFKLTPMERMATGGAIPRDQFLPMLQSHLNVGAVVLFCAFPLLEPQDYAALKQSGVKVITASACMPGYRKLVESQVIHLAIVPQFESPATTGSPPKSLREWFDAEFLVVSATNAAALPY